MTLNTFIEKLQDLQWKAHGKSQVTFWKNGEPTETLKFLPRHEANGFTEAEDMVPNEVQIMLAPHLIEPQIPEAVINHIFQKVKYADFALSPFVNN